MPRKPTLEECRLFVFIDELDHGNDDLYSEQCRQEVIENAQDVMIRAIVRSGLAAHHEFSTSENDWHYFGFMNDFLGDSATRAWQEDVWRWVEPWLKTHLEELDVTR